MARHHHDAPKIKLTREKLRTLLPEVWGLVRSRRSVLALGLVLIVINRLAGMVLPASTKFLIDDVIGKGDRQMLGWLVAAVIGATLIEGITSYSTTQLLSKAGQRLIAELRMRVQQHVGRLPISYYDSTKTGSLVSRIMNDVEGVRNLVGTGLVQLVGGLLTACFALVILLRIDTTLTLLVLGIATVFIVILERAFRTLRPIFRERWKINAEVTGRLTESLGGVRVVKGYHAEAREADVFETGVLRILDNVFKTLTGIALVGLSSTVLLGLVGALVMFMGAGRIFDGSMTTGDFIMFTAFLAVMVAPLFQMVNIGTQITEAFAGLERMREILSERQEDDEPDRTVHLPTIQGEVVFEDVVFAYEAGKPVLHGVSFDARPDTVTALVGSSGSGKSTTIGLIAGFYTPTEGRVLVDGVDLSTVRLSSYRTQLGVVLQDTFLFDGTIQENVAFARPDATPEQVLEACRIARVDEFAERFDDKYATIVGERGVKLSGGQRQRVSIARAILADPRILILDEATSSLDSESEQLIQSGLSYLMKGRTTFVIAHRLSTIRKADQILVMEEGRILERGTHESLYRLRGRYHDLYTRQHGVETDLFLAPGEGDSIPECPARADKASPVLPQEILREV